MNDTKQIPIWLQRLWRSWYGLLAVLLIVRFAFLNEAEENTRFFVFAAYGLISWLPIVFINMGQGTKLSAYLRENHLAHRRVWGRIGGLVPNTLNMTFLKSSEDFGDDEIKRLKHEYSDFRKLALTIFFTMPLVFVAFMVGVKPNSHSRRAEPIPNHLQP